MARSDEIDSEFGPYGYQVVEIKSARNIKEGHILQGALYNRVVGVLQGFEPPEFYIVNRDREVTAVQMKEVSDRRGLYIGRDAKGNRW